MEGEAGVCLGGVKMMADGLSPCDSRPTDNFQEKYKQQGYTTLPKDAWRNLSVVYDAYDWEVYKVRDLGRL